MKDFSVQDFIQDFLEEAAEHLRNIRHNLLALEKTYSGSLVEVEAAAERITLVDELFRSFHTLKGLSGMIGLSPAEQISHALKSVLRAIQHAEIDIQPQVIDRLLAGTQALEDTVQSLNNPDAESIQLEAVLEAIEALHPPRPPRVPEAIEEVMPAESEPGVTLDESSLASMESLLQNFPEIPAAFKDAERQRWAAAESGGRYLYLALFTPHAEKARQGQSVSQVRQQILNAGEIIKAMPLVQGTAIQFAFVVATDRPLEQDGMIPMEWVTLSVPNEVQVTVEQPMDRQGEGLQAGLQAANPHPHPSPTGQATTVRVDINRLEGLMRLVSDLIVARSRLVEISHRLQGAPAPALEDLEQTILKMERSLRDLRQGIVRSRMVPVSEVFSHMPLAVRDLSRSSGKEVQLVVEGENTEVDRLLIDRLLDPLLHLVRNAIAHGLETVQERTAAGKLRYGTLKLCATPEGDRILIEVSDDGRGIDRSQVAKKAGALGYFQPAAIERGELPSDLQILDWICRPGFTTRHDADLGAGRGVGLDVVQKTVAGLGGFLSLQTEAGQGTTFRMRFPLTLTVLDAMIVSCGPERFAIPKAAIDAVVEIDPGQARQIQGGEILPFRQDALTVLRLADLFAIPTVSQPYFQYGLVFAEGQRRTVLVVDRVIGLQEVVVRPVVDPLVRCPGVSGATELGDGSVILILDLPTLLAFKKRT